MPVGSTPVRHYQQSSPGACLPACVRMALAELGDERPEAEWAAILGSYEFGTPASRVLRLAELGYQVSYGPSSLDIIQAELAQGRSLSPLSAPICCPGLTSAGFTRCWWLRSRKMRWHSTIRRWRMDLAGYRWMLS